MCPGIAEKSSTGVAVASGADSCSTCPGIAEKSSLLMYYPLILDKIAIAPRNREPIRSRAKPMVDVASDEGHNNPERLAHIHTLSYLC